jgi:photosystem II stability/assembly factor-like uncharacterized protein
MSVAHPQRRSPLAVRRPHRRFLLVERLEDRFAPAAWVEQGPGVITNVLVEIPAQGNPATGAVEAIAVDPTNANIAYAGAVNGGVWRTDNFASANPLWRPLTDQQLPFLDINSVAISPVNHNEIFAGAGPTSSDALFGAASFGIGRSLDGGKHWQVLGASTLAGQAIRKVVPTSLNGGQVVLAAAFQAGQDFTPPFLTEGGGLYRSTDGGVSWTQISGAPGTGLPAESVSDLVADPGNPNRFYAGVDVLGPFATGNEGVYRSDDGGQTWTQVNNGLNLGLFPQRVLLAVHDSATGNAVYAMVVNAFGKLGGVFRSTDQGNNWTSLGTPPIDIYQNRQGTLHGAIAADPNDPNVVYISGDGDFTRPGIVEAPTVMRGDTSLLPNNIWTNVYADGANNTAPHPDSRALAFDDNCNLVYTSDGGVYRLNQPNDPATRQWRSTSLNLRDVEFHNVAYDPLSKVVLGGTQDNGTPIQANSGKGLWDASFTVPGDGGFVQVDADQTAHPGTSIRYNSGQFLFGANRSTWDANNNFLGSSILGLNIVAGQGAGQNLFNFDPFIQFYNPIAVNTVDSSRVLIGTASIYESFDRGDSLTNLNFFNGAFVGGTPFFNDGYGQPMVYGGHLGGVGNPDVIWAGVGNQIVYREHLSDPLQAVPGYQGDYVQAVGVDPQNYQHVFVVDGSSQIWASLDAGQTFLNITANLTQLTPFATTLEVVSRGPAPQDEMLVAGGLNGVFALGTHSTGQQPWYRLGDNLPNALVLDLRYSAQDNLLLAGTLGRGAWTLQDPLHTQSGGTAAPAAAGLSTQGTGNAADDASLAAFLLNTNFKGTAASVQPPSPSANRDSAAAAVTTTTTNPQASAMRIVDAVYGRLARHSMTESALDDMTLGTL